MTPPIALYVDGVRVADGSPGYTDSTAPYAIDGLNVSWGRPTTVDQPAASTCTFDISARQTYPDAAELFAGRVQLGRRIDVEAGTGVKVFVGQVTDVSM